VRGVPKIYSRTQCRITLEKLMTPLKNPPSGLGRSPDSFLRRQQREIAFYFSASFRLHLIHFCGCFLIILLQGMLMTTPLVTRFENVCGDFFFRNRHPIAMHPAIVHIDMAEDSLREFGRWPWPRYNHAAMVRILHQWGAKAIVFDVIFSDPSTSFDDGALAQAIKEAGNVYLPVMLETLNRRKTWVHSMPAFEDATKGIGHVNVFPDKDGTIRRVRVSLSSDGKTYVYLGAKVALDYLGRDLSKEKPEIPSDNDGDIFINWVGRWKESFLHYSYLDVIKSYAETQSGRPPIIPPDKFKDKICVIGLTAIGLTDIKANPMEAAYPAVGVQTNIMNSILTQQFARPIPVDWNRGVLWGIGILVSLFFIFSPRTTSLVFGLALGFLWVLFSFWIFVERGLWICTISPLILIFELFVFSAIFSIAVGKREEERLFTLATRDGLTGLCVIRHFRNLINQAAAEAYKKKLPLSVVLLDLDFFKKINDQYGHVAGDEALKHVAQTLLRMTRTEGEGAESNVVGRYGGEEFILMFRKCQLADAADHYAEKIRREFEQNSFVYEGVKIPMTVSLGVSTLGSGERISDMMILRADEALYRAKNGGRNRVCTEKTMGENSPEDERGLKDRVS